MPPKNHTQSVTMLGGHNVAPTETKKPRSHPPKAPESEQQKPAASVPPETSPPPDPQPDPPG